MTVFNLRGTSGSGKTTVVYGLLDRFGPAEPILGEKGKPEGYYLPSLNLRIVGRYTMACGGCDTIKVDEAESRVRRYLDMGHVLFEGLLISGIYGRWKILSEELKQRRQRFVWCFMDTPLELCKERIQIRNGGKPVNDANTIGKYRGTLNGLRKAEEAGEIIYHIDPYQSLDSFVSVLKEEGVM